MDGNKKELELLKQLSAQRRIELLEAKVSDLENLLSEVSKRIRAIGFSSTKTISEFKNILDELFYKAVEMSTRGGLTAQIILDLLKEKGVITDEDVSVKLDDKYYLEEFRKQQSKNSNP
ncbi:hypothetical protein [uncultured Veillonella sp.]|uniref:hypothetical protein n=1 Tax=uncultured Veillonella sp. TaxID=159268 RepID=UPI0025997AED|nr:hypothetical protein [uncultured Veillonella sp.]